jgi:DNA-binding beta-propeller fold protein YncE
VGAGHRGSLTAVLPVLGWRSPGETAYAPRMIRPYVRRRLPWQWTWRRAAMLAAGAVVLACVGFGGVVAVSLAQAPDCVTAAPPVAPAAATRLPAASLSGHPVASAPVSGDLVFVSLRPWVSGDRSGIEVLRGQGGALHSTAVIPLASPPSGLALSPDGRVLLAAEDDGVAVLDVARAAAGDPSSVLGTISTGPGAGTSGLAIAGGRYVFTVDETAGRVTVLDLPRLESGDYGPSSLVGTIDVDMGPAGVAVSPNGRYVYVVSQVQRPVVSVGPSDFLYGLLTYVGLPRRGGTLSVIDVKRMELDPTNSVVAHVAAGCGPVQVAASPDGSLVWVVAKRSNELLAFRSAQLATGAARPVAQAPVGAAPDGLRLVRNGAVALVASSDHSQEPSTPQTVHVVDTAAALAGRPALRSAVAVGGMPQEIDLSPDQRTAYVANSGTSSLSTMDLSSVLGT